jgi:hypothetical protein
MISLEWATCCATRARAHQEVVVHGRDLLHTRPRASLAPAPAPATIGDGHFHRSPPPPSDHLGRRSRWSLALLESLASTNQEWPAEVSLALTQFRRIEIYQLQWMLACAPTRSAPEIGTVLGRDDASGHIAPISGRTTATRALWARIATGFPRYEPSGRAAPPTSWLWAKLLFAFVRMRAQHRRRSRSADGEVSMKSARVRAPRPCTVSLSLGPTDQGGLPASR